MREVWKSLKEVTLIDFSILIFVIIVTLDGVLR